MSRRQLFGLFRATPEPEPAEESVPALAPAPTPAPEPSADEAALTPGADAASPFSLDAFYAARTSAPALPAFAVKAEVAVATTRVGLGRTGAATPAVVPAAVPAAGTVALPPGLVPRVLEHNCLATRSFCSVCVERCPHDGAIVTERGWPRIVESQCDGCGHCIAACPAPILALELVARAPRGAR